jgi:PAS domain S-box-containing protein
VALYDRNTETFRFPFWADQFDPVPGPLKVGRSCTAYVFRTGRPSLITQEVFDKLARRGEVELVGTPSPIWLGVPLTTPSETLGVLVVQHYEDPQAYTERDLDLLISVGGQIALAIQRKQVEDALRRSEAKYRSLVQDAPYGIYRASSEGRFLDVNPALVEMLGYSSEAELLAVHVPTEVYCDADEWARTFQNHPQHIEGVVAGWKRKDGTPITVRLSGRRVGDLDGGAGYELIAENVTEQRVLEQQLRQAQKMEAVGRLAGGIAHDFNNLLMVVQGHTELLLERAQKDESVRRKVEQIQNAAERAAALTHQLLAFSRMQVLQPRVLDLNTVVMDMGKLLPRLIGEDIGLMVRTDPLLGRVKADPGQMEQVLLNLAINARDAMPNGGKLTIETANVELDEAYARRHPPLVKGRFVLLAVSDTGTGMDAETQGHIFEPFFTTKQKGRGTGLGLATVYGVVKQSGGYIW